MFQEKYIENERKLQDQLNELRTNLAQLGESKRMKQKNIEENTMNVAEIRRELTVIGSGGAALEGVEQELQRAVSVCVCVCNAIKTCSCCSHNPNETTPTTSRTMN